MQTLVCFWGSIIELGETFLLLPSFLAEEGAPVRSLFPAIVRIGVFNAARGGGW
jgi:hypothetical protein